MEETELLIIGSGIAAISAAEAAHKQNTNMQIHICTKDTSMPYYRLRLPERICENCKNLDLHPTAWYAENGIQFQPQKEATALDAQNKLVTFADGSSVRYEKLIIATGSSSFVPPIPGIDGEHIHTLWTLEDADNITADYREGESAVVIGGGLLGLETAHKLHDAGAKVTILESFDRLVARQTDPTASDLFLRKIESLGIQVITSAKTREICDTENGKEVVLDDGTRIPCDLIVVSTGVRANTNWLNNSGITIDKRIVINHKMETNLPDVYAVGDVATQDALWFGLWAVAKSQGQTAGINAAGGESDYTLQVPPYILNTMDSSIVSAGIYPAEKQEFEDCELNTEDFTYKRIIYTTSDKSGPILGYILLGKKFARENMNYLKRLQLR